MRQSLYVKYFSCVCSLLNKKFLTRMHNLCRSFFFKKFIHFPQNIHELMVDVTISFHKDQIVFIAAKNPKIYKIRDHETLVVNVAISVIIAISRSPQEGASGCTTVDSGGAFRGCFQCWCSTARYCIVYNNIYSDVCSRCCVHGALSRNNVSVSMYMHIQSHTPARVSYVNTTCTRMRRLAIELIVKAGCLHLRIRCIGKGARL